VRNAIDHGIETADERAAAGKSATGLLILRTSLKAGRLSLEVEDEGRGIDWERVATAARTRGLPTETQRDLEMALFHDDLSTRETATDTSGRGVGLSAVREVCAATEGEVLISSMPGRGTTFRLEWSVDKTGRRVSQSGADLTGTLDQAG
jgi:two-component system chemotaxis sensor kinase CheA